MVCIVKGNDIYIRAQNWKVGEDFVWKCSKVNANDWAGNRFFNIEAAYTCPAASQGEDLSELRLWKESHDDICPVKIQGTYIGANHGFFCVDEVTSPGHGKTEADIGSVWSDSLDRTFCLVKVPSSDSLHFVMFDDDSMSCGKMVCGSPSGTLVHSTGGSHCADIIIQSCKGNQLWQSFNHYSLTFLADGEQQPRAGTAVLHGENFAIETVYDLIYVPSMLEYLMANTRKCTNESHHSDAITDSYLRMGVRYEFHENGSISTFHSFQINHPVSLQYIGLVQSMAIAKPAYAYIPDTVYENLTPQDDSLTLHFHEDNWNSLQKVPYRYYQFADLSYSKGMALAYDRSFGWGSNISRLNRSDHAGMYFRSLKQYPAFISGAMLQAGERFEGFAAKMPLYQYDKDLTAVCWYWIGGDIVLMLDTHRSVDKDITLPEYMNGKVITVLDKTDSCSVVETIVSDNKVRFQSKGYGYLVLKLQ